MPELNNIHLTLSDSNDIMNVLTSPEVVNVFRDEALHSSIDTLQTQTQKNVADAQQHISESKAIQELLANRELVQKIGKLHTKLLCEKI